MEDELSIFVIRDGACVVLTEWVGTLEVGRQVEGEPEPFRSHPAGPGGWRRLIMAPRGALAVSRRQLRIDALPAAEIRVENTSNTRSIEPDGYGELPPGSVRVLDLPARIGIDDWTLLIEPVPPDVAWPTLVLREESSAPDAEDVATSSGSLNSETMISWLMSALGLLRSPTTSAEFFEQAARAVVEVGGLDSGAFLRRRELDWQVVASHRLSDDDSEWRPSRSILRSLCERKRALWEMPAVTTGVSPTLCGVNLAMAAPVCDTDGELIGALYGERHGSYGETEVNRVAATLVDLLASSVAAGIARSEQEQAATVARERFEAFFTPDLALQLDAHPDLLQGRKVEVTVLFADIHDFSRLAERLDPQTTVQWLREALTTLSDCVIAHEGVLVDYIGDEVLAMWGAPEPQLDHASRACRAAMDMLDALPELNRRLRAIANAEVRLGIGINTGIANVGDVGSRRKFKYGPIGNMVNLASRVQGITKHLASDVVVTHSTREGAGSEFASRRLCRIRVINIEEPVEVFELTREGDRRLSRVCKPYESALLAFEEGRYSEAEMMLGEVLAQEPTDGPALMLMSRTVRCLTESSGKIDPVWELPGK